MHMSLARKDRTVKEADSRAGRPSQSNDNFSGLLKLNFGWM